MLNQKGFTTIILLIGILLLIAAGGFGYYFYITSNNSSHIQIINPNTSYKSPSPIYASAQPSSPSASPINLIDILNIQTIGPDSEKDIDFSVTGPDGNTYGYIIGKGIYTGPGISSTDTIMYFHEGGIVGTNGGSTGGDIQFSQHNLLSGKYVLKIYGQNDGDFSFNIWTSGADLKTITGTIKKGETQIYDFALPGLNIQKD